MKAIVCGGRDYRDRAWLFQHMDDLRDRYHLTAIVHGDAPGTDRLAGEWAKARGVPCDVYPADWEAYGAAAGPIRNRKMAMDSGAEMVIAFPGGRGTHHMVTHGALVLGLVVKVKGRDE